MNKILVTGANGFVGRALFAELERRGHSVVGAVRSAPGPGQVAVGAIDADTAWAHALAGCDTVIHCAARVHMLDERSSDPLKAYRDVNLDGSLHLARQAVALGVRRFVFVSSIKVNGEASGSHPFGPQSAPAPADPYGQSKFEAEQGLLALSRATGLEVVIVRPPLVYGPGVKANFLNLVKLVSKGYPLPFASLQNRRSMVALDNLVDLLIVCGSHRAAPGQVFLVSDDKDLTMGELVGMISGAFGKKAVLVPVPVSLMRGAAFLLGKSALADRIFGSLQVDISHTKAALEWGPIMLPQAAIEKTVAHFLRTDCP